MHLCLPFALCVPFYLVFCFSFPAFFCVSEILDYMYSLASESFLAVPQGLESHTPGCEFFLTFFTSSSLLLFMRMAMKSASG